MLEEEGEVGFARFVPTIDLVTQPTGRRFLPGIDVSGAVQRSLQNQLAADPLRFQTVPEFLDFLEAGGII